MGNSLCLKAVLFITRSPHRLFFRSCFPKFWSADRRNRWHLGADLSGRTLPVIRGRKDILHKLFERSRGTVLRRTRLLAARHSCVGGLVHLPSHTGSIAAK